MNFKEMLNKLPLSTKIVGAILIGVIIIFIIYVASQQKPQMNWVQWEQQRQQQQQRELLESQQNVEKERNKLQQMLNDWQKDNDREEQRRYRQRTMDALEDIRKNTER